jgi:hypothetical protein
MLDRIEWIGSSNHYTQYYTHTEPVLTCACRQENLRISIYFTNKALQLRPCYADMHLYQSLLIKIVTYSFWEHQLSSFDGSVLKYFLLVMGARV